MDLKADLGKTLSLEQIEESLKANKPAVLFLCQVSLFPLLPCSPSVKIHLQQCQSELLMQSRRQRPSVRSDDITFQFASLELGLNNLKEEGWIPQN